MPVDQAPSPAPRPAARPKDATKLVRYHDYIDEKIESTRRMVKIVDLATALMELTVVLLAFLFVYALAEHWVIKGGFSFAVRCVLFGLVLVGVGWFAVRRLWPLCILAINPVYAAQTIEHGSPTLKNGLINLLLFRERRTEIPDAVYRTLEEQAAHGLTRVPVDTAVDRTQLIRLGYVLIAIVAIGAIYKVLSPKDPFVAAERVLMPWADLVPASRVSISDVAPGTQTISRGEFFDVTAEVRGLAEDESVVLRYTTEDGQIKGRAIPMKASGDHVKFSGRLADGADGPESIGLTRSSTYWLEAGDARSLDYAVTVVPAASILVERVEYDYPTYTGYVDRTVDGVGDIHAIEGTKITVHARANGPIREANVDFDADGRRDLTMSASEQKAHAQFELALRDDRITPKHASYVLRFTNEEGRANHDPVKHSIIVERDYEPEAGIRSPQEESLDVRQDQVVAIECEARDPDFALSKVRLRGQTGGRDVLDQQLLKVEGKQVTTTYRLTPNTAGLKAGDEFEYWIEASDNRTPKPNLTATKHKKLRILSPNPAQQPPPNQLAQNDRQQRPQPDQGQGDKGQQGKQGGEQQKGNDGGQGQAQQGQGQQGQGQQGQGKAGQGQQNQGEGQQGEGSQQGKADQQQGSGNAQSRPDGAAQNGEGNEHGNEQGDQQKQPGAQGQGGGKQSKPGDSKGNEGDQQQPNSEQNAGGNQQSKGSQQQQQGTRDKAGEQNAGQNSQQQNGGQKSEGQPQSNQAEEKPPVSSEGDNDAEAFDRIQKHMEQNGELKKDDAASGEKQGAQQQEKAGQQEKGEQGQAEKQQGDKQQGKQGDKQTGKQGQNSEKQQGNQQQGEQGKGEQAKGSQEQKPGAQQPGGQQKNEQGEGGAQTRKDDLKNGEKPNGEPQGQEKSPGGEQTSSKGDSGAGQQQKDSQGSPNSKPEMKPTEKPEQQPSKGDQSNQAESPAGANSKKESDSHGDQGGDKAGGGEEGGGQKSQRDGTGSAGQNQSADNGAGQSGEKGKGENSSEGGKDAKSTEKTGSSDGKTQGKGSQQRDGAGDKQGGQKDNQGGDQNAAGEQKAGGQQKEGNEQGKGQRAKGDKENSKQQGANEKGNEQGKQGAKQDGQDQQAGKQPGQEGNKQQGKQGEKQGEKNEGKQQDQDAGKDSGKGKEGADNSAAGGGSPEGGGKPGSVAMPNHGGETPDGEEANLEYARKQTDLVVDKLADQLKKKKIDDKLLKDLGWSEDELRRFVERWQQRRDAANRNDASADAAKKELDDALRSLGLQRDKLQQGAVKKDTMRDLQQGYHGPVPAEYKDRLRAYNQGVSRAKAENE